MSDPRKSADWKQLRHEQRVILLLGAILDALKPAVTVAAPPLSPSPPATTRTRKTNA